LSTVNDFGKIATALGLFASAIKSGEAWTGSCEAAKKDALDALARVGVQHEALMMALEAARLLEAAELFHANCEECGGDAEMELCGECFPLADAARLKRREALKKARATGIMEGKP
jgi:hypothetical protein